MNLSSEIITGAGNYRRSRKRRNKSRRRRVLSPSVFVVPLLIILLISGAFFGIKKLRLLPENRYHLSTSAQSLLMTAVPSLELPGAGNGLAVISASSEEMGGVSAESVILCKEGAQEVPVSKDALRHMNPASTTKIMTCLVALENASPDDVITAGPEVEVSDKAASMAYIHEGDTLTLRQALYGLMLPSGADAANIIAKHVAGGEEQFVALMNKRAEELFATDTHFTNTHGLTDEQHYTSAYDLYLILREAMKNETFREIAATSVYNAEFTSADGKTVHRKWKNTNQYYTGESAAPEGISILAGKTGTTLAAGNCLALAAGDPENAVWYAVVLKSAGKPALYSDMNALLEKIVQFD